MRARPGEGKRERATEGEGGRLGEGNNREEGVTLHLVDLSESKHALADYRKAEGEGKRWGEARRV